MIGQTISHDRAHAKILDFGSDPDIPMLKPAQAEHARLK
jgi:hypothetical protein